MDHVERRLTAIMFTDIVGYSALTEHDEMLAMELLQEHHSLLRPIFGRHDGAEVKTIGDAFMVEFPSVVNAVSSAIEMQQTMADRNAAESASRQIVVRIGIHVGDVIVRDHDVFGDGVNIASRIEPLAQPGGICVSEDVARQVSNKVAFPLTELGSAELKNIGLPMKVFSIDLPWLAPRVKATPAAPGSKARLVSTRVPQAWWKWGAAAAAVVLVAVAALLVGGGGAGVGDLAGAMSSVDVQAGLDGLANDESELLDVPIAEGDDDAVQAADGQSEPGEEEAAVAEATSAPTAPAGPSPDLVRRAGRASYEAGIYADAIEQFQQLVRLAPRDAEAFYYLGRSHAFARDTERAIANLTQATALQDDSSLYHIHLGLVLEQAARFDAAAVQMRRAIELGAHPDFSEDDLSARIAHLEVRTELASLAPHNTTVKHDHLVGSCSGELTISEESIAYTVDGDHAFNVWLTDVAALDGQNDKLSLELRSGDNFNFELASQDRERFTRIFQLAGQAKP